MQPQEELFVPRVALEQRQLQLVDPRRREQRAIEARILG